MNKYWLKKIIILTVIVLALEVFAGLIVFEIINITSTKNYYNQVECISSQRADDLENIIKTNLQELENDSSSLDIGYIDLEKGTVSAFNNEYLPLSNDSLNSIKQEKCSMFKFSDFVDCQQNDVYITYNYNSDDLTKRYFGYEKLSAVLSKIGNASEISIVSQTDRIIFSNLLTGKIQNYTNDFSLDKCSIISANKKQYLTIFNKVNIDDNYYVIEATHFDYSLINVANTKLKINIIAIFIVFFIILIVLYLLFVVRSAKQKIAINKFDKENKFNFFVKTDMAGNILAGNKNFKDDFSVANLFNYIVEKQSKGELQVGDNIWVSCTLKDGLEHIVNFFVIKKSKVFEFIGSSEDVLLNVKGELSNKKREIDIDGDIQAMYNSVKQKNQQFLFGVFEITNYNQIEIMFGHDFAYKYFASVCKKIKGIFSSIFVLKENQVAVIITSDIQENIDGLKDTMLNLNKPVDVLENTLKVECIASFVHVDEAMADGDYAYVMKCIKATFRRLKDDKKSLYYVFHESQKKLYRNYFEYDFDIQAMLSNDSFMMEFQPQYSLSKKKIVGVEALFRIKPTLQLDIDIYDFIVYAEKVGMIMKISDFVMKESFKFAKTVEDSGISVSVNVSPIQFLQDGFVSSFLDLYNQFNLKPHSICIEITESFFISNFEVMVQKIEEIKRHNIEIHLDDFGTSYSSLVYLKRLPIDLIKIDKCFIDDVEKKGYGLTVVKLILGFAKELNLKVIAEGVETIGQQNILTDLGCDIIQGFIIGRSMQGEKIKEILTEEKKADDKQ